MNGNDQHGNPNGRLAEAVNILKACQPLVARLTMHGVTIQLSKHEEADLLKFKQLMQTNYSDSDWSYLRIASGTKVSGIAALNNYLRLHQTS